MCARVLNSAELPFISIYSEETKSKLFNQNGAHHLNSAFFIIINTIINININIYIYNYIYMLCFASIPTLFVPDVLEIPAMRSLGLTTWSRFPLSDTGRFCLADYLWRFMQRLGLRRLGVHEFIYYIVIYMK